MTIEERTVGDVIVLDLKGKITMHDFSDDEFRHKIVALMDQGHKNVLLNLEEVPYIDAAGYGEVVRSYENLRKLGGALKMLKPTQRIVSALSIMKLLSLFDTYDDEDEGVKSFKPAESTTS